MLLNKSSTSASALITAQLLPARPPGSVCVYGGVYVNYPTLVAAAAEMCVCFCAFLAVCLLGYQALVGAVAMVLLHTGRPGWLKALVEFWKNEPRDDCSQRQDKSSAGVSNVTGVRVGRKEVVQRRSKK